MEEFERQEEKASGIDHVEREGDQEGEDEDDEDELSEFEEEPRENSHHEEEPDHPVLNELYARLEEVTQNGHLDQMRSLHSELHARHVMARQEALRRITDLI